MNCLEYLQRLLPFILIFSIKEMACGKQVY